MSMKSQTLPESWFWCKTSTSLPFYFVYVNRVDWLRGLARVQVWQAASKVVYDPASQGTGTAFFFHCSMLYMSRSPLAREKNHAESVRELPFQRSSFSTCSSHCPYFSEYHYNVRSAPDRSSLVLRSAKTGVSKAWDEHYSLRLFE